MTEPGALPMALPMADALAAFWVPGENHLRQILDAGCWARACTHGM